MRRSAISNQLLVFILATGSFAGATSNMSPIPLLKPIGADFGVTDAAVGQLATLHSLTATAMALIAAPWMDRFPRRTILRVCIGVIALGTIMSALAPTFGWLLVARAIAGTATGIIFPSVTATAADLFEDQNRRAQAIGANLSAASISVVLSVPIIAQIEGFADWRWAFMAVLLPFALVLVGTWWLPSKPTTAQEIAQESVWGAYLSRYRLLLGRADTTSILALVALRSLVWNGWLVYLGAYIITVFAVGNTYVSLIFLVFGLAHAFGGNLTPILLRFVSNRAVVTLGTLLLSFNLLAIGVLFVSVWSMFIFVILGGLAGAGLSISMNLLLLNANPSARGSALSLQSATGMLGGALGTGLAGLLLSLLGSYQNVYQSLGFVMAIGLLFIWINARAARALPAEPVAGSLEIPTGKPLG